MLTYSSICNSKASNQGRKRKAETAEGNLKTGRAQEKGQTGLITEVSPFSGWWFSGREEQKGWGIRSMRSWQAVPPTKPLEPIEKQLLDPFGSTGHSWLNSIDFLKALLTHSVCQTTCCFFFLYFSLLDILWKEKSYVRKHNVDGQRGSRTVTWEQWNEVLAPHSRTEP